MIGKSWKLGALAILCLGRSVFAQPASMTLTSAGSDLMANAYIDPYTATINGFATQVICNDYIDNTYINESWTAAVSNVASLGSLIRFKQSTPQATQQAYDAAAWLAEQILLPANSNPTVRGEITFALWNVFDTQAFVDLKASNTTYYNDALTWYTQATTQSYTPGQFSNVLVYSVDTSYPITCPGGCPTTPPQEVFVVTPEPPFLALSAVDLLSLLALILFLRGRVAGSRPCFDRVG